MKIVLMNENSVPLCEWCRSKLEDGFIIYDSKCFCDEICRTEFILEVNYKILQKGDGEERVERMCLKNLQSEKKRQGNDKFICPYCGEEVLKHQDAVYREFKDYKLKKWFHIECYYSYEIESNG